MRPASLTPILGNLPTPTLGNRPILTHIAPTRTPGSPIHIDRTPTLGNPTPGKSDLVSLFLSMKSFQPNHGRR
jgi:hypothetical protein